MFSEKSPENGYVFSDVKFVPLETLRQKPPSDEKRGEMSETVKDTIIRANAASEEILKKVTKPIEIDGALWKYNVDVIGFVIINFKKEDLQSGTGQPVGIAPDGSLCFASLIPMSH